MHGFAEQLPGGRVPLAHLRRKGGKQHGGEGTRHDPKLGDEFLWCDVVGYGAGRYDGADDESVHVAHEGANDITDGQPAT